MLQTELNKIGFNLRNGSGDMAQVLYPHYVGHPIGVGRFSHISIRKVSRQLKSD